MSNIKSIFNSVATKAKKLFEAVKSVFKNRKIIKEAAVAKAICFFDENPWSGFAAGAVAFVTTYIYLAIGFHLVIPLNLSLLGVIAAWFVWFKVASYIANLGFTLVVCGVATVKYLTYKPAETVIEAEAQAA